MSPVYLHIDDPIADEALKEDTHLRGEGEG